MNILNISCPNCHASLETDIDNLMVYCPYCRTKLPIDVDVDNYISEKQETIRKQIDIEHWEKQDKKDRRERCIRYVFEWGLVIAFLLFLLIRGLME